MSKKSQIYLEPDDGVTVYKKFVWVGEVSCKVEILIQKYWPHWKAHQLKVNVTENDKT